MPAILFLLLVRPMKYFKCPVILVQFLLDVFAWQVEAQVIVRGSKTDTLEIEELIRNDP